MGNWGLKESKIRKVCCNTFIILSIYKYLSDMFDLWLKSDK